MLPRARARAASRRMRPETPTGSQRRLEVYQVADAEKMYRSYSQTNAPDARAAFRPRQVLPGSVAQRRVEPAACGAARSDSVSNRLFSQLNVPTLRWTEGQTRERAATMPTRSMRRVDSQRPVAGWRSSSRRSIGSHSSGGGDMKSSGNSRGGRSSSMTHSHSKGSVVSITSNALSGRHSHRVSRAASVTGATGSTGAAVSVQMRAVTAIANQRGLVAEPLRSPSSRQLNDLLNTKSTDDILREKRERLAREAEHREMMIEQQRQRDEALEVASRAASHGSADDADEHAATTAWWQQPGLGTLARQKSFFENMFQGPVTAGARLIDRKKERKVRRYHASAAAKYAQEDEQVYQPFQDKDRPLGNQNHFFSHRDTVWRTEIARSNRRLATARNGETFVKMRWDLNLTDESQDLFPAIQLQYDPTVKIVGDLVPGDEPEPERIALTTMQGTEEAAAKNATKAKKLTREQRRQRRAEKRAAAERRKEQEEEEKRHQRLMQVHDAVMARNRRRSTLITDLNVANPQAMLRLRQAEMEAAQAAELEALRRARRDDSSDEEEDEQAGNTTDVGDDGIGTTNDNEHGNGDGPDIYLAGDAGDEGSGQADAPDATGADVARLQREAQRRRASIAISIAAECIPTGGKNGASGGSDGGGGGSGMAKRDDVVAAEQQQKQSRLDQAQLIAMMDEMLEDDPSKLFIKVPHLRGQAVHFEVKESDVAKLRELKDEFARQRARFMAETRRNLDRRAADRRYAYQSLEYLSKVTKLVNHDAQVIEEQYQRRVRTGVPTHQDIWKTARTQIVLEDSHIYVRALCWKRLGSHVGRILAPHYFRPRDAEGWPLKKQKALYEGVLDSIQQRLRQPEPVDRSLLYFVISVVGFDNIRDGFLLGLVHYIRKEVGMTRSEFRDLMKRKKWGVFV